MSARRGTSAGAGGSDLSTYSMIIFKAPSGAFLFWCLRYGRCTRLLPKTPPPRPVLGHPFPDRLLYLS